MQIINDNEIVVSNSDELKEILEGTNTYTHIYFNNNITLTKGISISSTKKTVIIDGTYNGITYELQDKSTLNASDTISASSPNISKVTVCNMNIIGNNYYGIIYVPENTSYKNIITEYNNITYTGPQICFNPNGTTRFIDCNITINDTSLTVGNEVAECNKIEIGGTSNILHNSKSNSAFWFRNETPSFTILEDSSVTFTSTYRELFYGTNALTLNIQKNAYFNLTSNSGMAYGTFGTKNTILAESSTFIINQTARNSSYPTWYSYGTITLENFSALNIINNYTGITSSNYNIYFQTRDSGLILNNPKEVILYNQVANIIATAYSIPFSFTFSRINLFTNVINITDNIQKSSLPTYSWYKDNDLSIIKGTFTSTAAVITENNFTESEISNLYPLSNFIFPNKKILSIGLTKLNVNSITDASLEITGYTLNNASTLIEYETTSSVAVSSNNGTFTHALNNTLEEGTTISFITKQQNKPIYINKKVQIVYKGDLSFEVTPDLIEFSLSPISTNPIICPKKDQINIIITDTRIDKSWKLYASISEELISENNNTLNNSLIFIDENNIEITLSTTRTLIKEISNTEETITNITFEKDKGILLKLSNPIHANEKYKTKIIWEIE